MKLLTYRINQIDRKEKGVLNKLVFLKALNDSVLHKDRYWHYFLDPRGGTLRFQPEFEQDVVKFINKHAKNYALSITRRSPYIPAKHEYYGVSYLGDDILPMFHEMSLLALKYPYYVIVRPIQERLNHGLVNMTGLHDFAAEAELYLKLAYGRARMVRYPIAMPNFVRNVLLWLIDKFDKYDSQYVQRYFK